LVPQVVGFFSRQLEHEIVRKPVAMAPDRPVERLGLDPVEFGQVSIKQ